MQNFIENRKILYIDDEIELLNAFTDLMRKEKYQIFTLQDSRIIKETLEKEGPFAIVLSDQRMPVYDGVKVLETTQQIFPDTIRVLITGYSDHKDTVRAINIGGINSYISKPWDDDEVKRQIRDWVSQYNLKKHNKYLLNLLDEENKKLNELLDGTVAQTVRILGDLANHVSPYISDLGEKVKTVGNAFLKAMPNLTPQERWEILRAFDLFNLGVALLPPSLQLAITREGLAALNNSAIARNHHLLAAGLLKDIPQFSGVAKIIELQAKDFNGFGEPINNNIRGEEIPFGARLMHILIDLVKPGSVNMRGAELLQKMENLPLKYDVKIIKQILGKNLDTNFTTEVKLLSLESLKPGMVLLNDIRSNGGQLLLKANLGLTETFINILVQWHVRDPIIEPIKVYCMT
jgi:response regulator RpfG family c-di-GMP phosphodiesterase